VTGDYLSRIPLGVGDHSRRQFGKSYLAVHRGDLHRLMIDAIDAENIQYSKTLVDIEETTQDVIL
jgi:6-hydroxynicotinate 3-monooxygenase